MVRLVHLVMRVSRVTPLLLCACLPLAAVDTRTLISGTLYYPDGSTPTCTITVDGPNYPGAVTSGGVSVTPVHLAVNVAAGAYSVRLQPNDALIPAGTSYSARYQCTSGPAPYTETWVVPTSVTAVTIGQIRVKAVAGSTMSIAAAQLSAKGITTGWCVKSANGLAVWSSTCGAGAGKTWNEMTMAWSSVSGSWASQ